MSQKKLATSLAVIYTRVSGKGQFDKNESLETQRKSEVFRTPEISFIIAEIDRHTGDLAKIKKDLPLF